MIEMKNDNKVTIEFEIDSTIQILINLSILISSLLLFGKLLGLHDWNIIWITCPVWLPPVYISIWIYFKIIIKALRCKKWK